jgi:hypothetical protein
VVALPATRRVDFRSGVCYYGAVGIGEKRSLVMAYTVVNFRTKRALKEAVANGEEVEVFQPGPFGPNVRDGVTLIEGPHYPEPHRWYAQAEVKDGKIVKVK